jgi:hypothetical protein
LLYRDCCGRRSGTPAVQPGLHLPAIACRDDFFVGILLAASPGCVRQAAVDARRRPSAAARRCGQVAGCSEAAAWSRVSKSSSRSSMPASSKLRRAGPGGQMMRSARSSRPSTARDRTSTLTPLESGKVTSQRSMTNAPRLSRIAASSVAASREAVSRSSLRAGARRAPLRSAPGQRPVQAVDALSPPSRRSRVAGSTRAPF